MTALDGVVLLLVAVAALIGYRLGFVVRALSWLGLAIGVAVALRITPRLAQALAGVSPGVRLLSVASLMIGLALIGHAAGMMASQAIRRHRHVGEHVSPLDRVAGAVLGALGVLALLWLLVPALRSTPGWPAREAQGSAAVSMLDSFGPTQPHSARLLGRIVSESPYPLFDDAHVSMRPPTTDAGPRIDAQAANSVVLVRGDACGLQLSGTGFAVARHLLVTNAHVVAGERDTTVTTRSGRTAAADVVVFDPLHDVAVLRVDGLTFAPLPLTDAKLGTIASVLGHPRGGQLRATPARLARWIDAPRTDVYRGGTITTRILGLAAHLIVGDSGAPVVDPQGRVHGVVFAVDPASATTAFALTTDELRPYLRLARRAVHPASTRTCLVG